jgi:aminopeptidase N
MVAGAFERELICRYRSSDSAEEMQIGLDFDEEGRRYAPDRSVDVLHIKLDVRPDFARRTISGTTYLTFSPISQPLSSLRLDAVNLTISAVRCPAGVADFVSTAKDLEIQFAHAIPPGTKTTIEIDYSAEPLAGLYFRTPEMGYPAGDTHCWTQGETHEARCWFPCFDYPNERSSTEIICRVPPDMTVLSNGRKLGEMLDSSTGLKAVHWYQEKPHVNYLICLVAGYLKGLTKQHRDVQLGFYTQPSLFEHAANSFEDTPAIMEFYEQEIGVPFPWDKYDQVTICDFTAGGMENTSLTTLTHRTIFSKASENIRSTRGLDAHEMAHQWFGDLVTCKDWSHLWLNEGFATYYALLYEGHKFGDDALRYGLYEDATDRVLTRQEDTRPIVFNQYKNSSEQFDYRAYPKGSWVLHMLRCQLGPDLYRDCIREYLMRHALSSVVTDDLRQIMEQKSGRTFDQFFDQWVYHARHPDLKIEYQWLPETKLAKVTVRQTQQVNDHVLLFHLPTKVRFVVGGNDLDRQIVIDREQHDFYFPLAEKPTVVRFDPDYTLLARVEFDLPDEMLFNQLDRKNDMMGRLLATVALGNRRTQQSVQRLKKTLNEDPFFGVRLAASESLQKIQNDGSFKALAESLRQADARVRLRVVRDIASFYRDESLEILKTVAAYEPNPAIRAEAIRALGQYPPDKTRNDLLTYLRTESFGDEIALAATAAIEQQKDPSYRDPLMETIAERVDQFDSRSIGQTLSTLAVICSQDDDKTPVRNLLEGYLSSPKQAVRVAAIRALGELKDPRTASMISSFIVPDSPDRVSQAAAATLKEIQEQAALVPAEVIELRNLVQKVKEENEKLRKDLDDLKARVEATNGTK